MSANGNAGASSSGSSSQRTLSRVNSFKREWGDDDVVPIKGSSAEVVKDWSPSPER